MGRTDRENDRASSEFRYGRAVRARLPEDRSTSRDHRFNFSLRIRRNWESNNRSGLGHSLFQWKPCAGKRQTFIRRAGLAERSRRNRGRAEHRLGKSRRANIEDYSKYALRTYSWIIRSVLKNEPLSEMRWRITPRYNARS